MPAYSLSAKDLRQILENSKSYDNFMRTRPVTANMPLTSFGYRKQRTRSRSRSKSRTRARSTSHSRTHHVSQSNCCKSNANGTQKPLPPGLPRPQSAKTRPRSAKVEYSDRPRSAHTRPQSAKTRSQNANANLPKRPSSAQPRMRYSEDFDSKKMDFTGLSNMMRSVSINPSRKWRSKSPSQDNKRNKSKTDIILEDLETKPIKSTPPVDQNQLRKSRSSTYAKFKYPEKYHKSTNNKHLIIEENIPQCLRKFPRYINQPKRHDCSYNPQSGAVSWVTRHNVKSGKLPSYQIIGEREKKSTAVISFDADHQDTAREIVGVESSRDSYDDDDDERQRNGNFHYVYKSKSSDVILDMDDLDEDNGNQNVSPTHAHSGSDDDDVRSSTPHRYDRTDDTFSESQPEKTAKDNEHLPRTDSQDDFEKLLSKITGGEGNSEKSANNSWERPPTPLSDFHDDSDDGNNRTFKAKKDWSSGSSDVESVPEEIE